MTVQDAHAAHVSTSLKYASAKSTRALVEQRTNHRDWPADGPADPPQRGHLGKNAQCDHGPVAGPDPGAATGCHEADVDRQPQVRDIARLPRYLAFHGLNALSRPFIEGAKNVSRIG